ncbi:hypothetical protein LWP59_06035 [Amycolatopsis acidiphila]|uniref:Uncharacterized protein n=1 Tax=Amycolatopsis acidiphila TaxID=715473 RepID=A0A558AHS3_9PSEU|nr:hypothetical protein [Amycolatopsis acidiphila]TVT23826.1 hypothetical protein FNH06_08110 [Amycolatopsis acidiphila]UIJ61197.1 hypothetical protein LWP59_06035 [Amycolatopsis acidiphila]GHG97898.1 hypothetical protein GCM10017788_77670 [Amycolatopsis acidiphila]
MSVRTTDTGSHAAPASRQAVPASRGFARPVLWLLLVVSATCNVVASVSNLVVVSVVFGVITLSLGAALVMHHYRGRRR